LQSQLGHLSSVDILETDFVDVVNRPGFLGALLTHAAAKHTAERTAAAEKLGKEILSVHSGTAGTALEAFFTILIVDLTLLGVGKDFVGMGELFERLGRLRVGGVLV
jgi:hypothetical protein